MNSFLNLNIALLALITNLNLILSLRNETNLILGTKEHSSSGAVQKAEKVLILSDGQQLKLYPFEKNKEQLISEKNFYLLKDVTANCKHQVFAKAKSISKTSLSSNDIITIAKNALIFEKIHENCTYKSQNEVKITSIDYFFDETAQFCDTIDNNIQKNKKLQKNSKCIVILWLDSAQKTVNIASLKLEPQVLGSKVSKNPNENVFYFDRSESFSYKVLFNNTSSKINDIGTGLLDLQVDRQTRRIYLRALLNKRYEVIFSQLIKATNSTTQFIDTENNNIVIDRWIGNSSFNIEDNTSRKNRNLVAKVNLRIDSSKSILFFSDDNGNIFKVNLTEGQSNDSLVIDTGKVSLDSKPFLFALDTFQSRVIWLDTARKIYSCDYNGRSIRFEGKLNKRPIIVNPFAMISRNNKLYISDADKKNLIVYPLPSSDITRNEEPRQDLRKFDINSSHKTLIVELNGLFGFDLIDLSTEFIKKDKIVDSNDGDNGNRVEFKPIGGINLTSVVNHSLTAGNKTKLEIFIQKISLKRYFSFLKAVLIVSGLTLFLSIGLILIARIEFRRKSSKCLANNAYSTILRDKLAHENPCYVFD